jgi:putative ABC transport system permease protein
MNWVTQLTSRVRALFRRQALDADMDEEMRSHIELQAQANLDAGMEPRQARRKALSDFGGMDSVQQDCREQRSIVWVECLLRDGCLALRSMGKNPGFTAMAVLTLALGIGGATAIFSLVDAILLKPLPYRDADRIVDLREKDSEGRPYPVSAANFSDWRAQNHVFESMAAYTPWSRQLSGTGEPEFLKGFQVSAHFFEVLGGQILLGREFRPEEEQGNHLAILSHTLWRDKFGADTNIVGRTLLVDGEKFTVVGVVKLFSTSDQSWAQIWTPLTLEPGLARDYRVLRALGRLKPGVTLEQARVEMEQIAHRLAVTYPDCNRDMGVRLKTFRAEAIDPPLKTMLLLLLGAVGALLLLASLNIGGLMLARGLARTQETAIRLALGAGRGRLISASLLEGLLLAVLGWAAGWFLAFALLKVLPVAMPLPLPQGVETAMDYRLLLFSLLMALLAGTASAALPAWQCSKSELLGALKGNQFTVAFSRRLSSSTALVSAQLALSMTLLTVAGLLFHSLLQLWHVDPGINPHNVLACEIWLPKARYDTDPQFAGFFTRVVDEIQAVPGVKSAALSTGLPVGGVGWTAGFSVEEHAEGSINQHGSAPFMVVSPGYFRTLGIPMMNGRSLSEHDRSSSPRVAVISQALAQHYFRKEEPLGKHISIRRILPFNQGLGALETWEIVGVAGNVKVSGLTDNQSDEIYVSYAQHPFPGMEVTIRTASSPYPLLPVVKRALWRIDPDLTFTYVNTMDSILRRSTIEVEFRSTLFAAFASAALALSAIGVYALISFRAVQRRNEIGIRMALGAQRSSILRMFLVDGLRVALPGVAIGLVAALGSVRFFESLLFGTKPFDPVIFAGMAFLLISVALAACLVSARSATRVDPMLAIRHEQ